MKFACGGVGGGALQPFLLDELSRILSLFVSRRFSNDLICEMYRTTASRGTWWSEGIQEHGSTRLFRTDLELHVLDSKKK